MMSVSSKACASLRDVNHEHGFGVSSLRAFQCESDVADKLHAGLGRPSADEPELGQHSSSCYQEASGTEAEFGEVNGIATDIVKSDVFLTEHGDSRGYSLYKKCQAPPPAPPPPPGSSSSSHLFYDDAYYHSSCCCCCVAPTTTTTAAAAITAIFFH